ncbi:Short-chain dehydrogenase [Algoriphagus alkaliphilus]|uniref:Short-chain dehydrogenase n=1 Tax=Algoriphagus alkaliphilus TaxID=279824 RepID=A0A1G5W393_9BACT|nr:SDR family oxidoreductase [Algoriphagus alkaliphilus]MBA4299376.1 short chain dehydrogenase [Cyclobacterium sp.]SDA52394.1 Short-chain dehydrogenase [Algoriphagus alkaliphilus]
MAKSVIWITGASSGIGEATAKKFSQEGYRVIISARNEEELNRVKSECSNPADVQVLPLDLVEIDSFDGKVSQAIAFFGKVDIILHNGGISQRSLIKETGLEVDRKLMEVNFFGTVALTKAILPHFVVRKTGQFAVVSSLVGKFGSPFRSSYAASKHALHGFFDTLRAEHFQDNITVTMICPGFIRTNVSVNALTADGSALGKMDEAQAKGMSPEACASEIYAAIARKKEEVYIGGKETFAVHLKRFFPAIFSKIIKKAKVR